MKCIALILSLVCFSAYPQTLDPMVDYRLGTEVMRDADGSIRRSTKVINAFKKIWPCPSTGKTYGSCPGWAIDHTVPLTCGGRDVVWNLGWMPLVIKSGPGEYPKDRWEQKVYCSPSEVVPMPVRPLPLLVAP